jgi:hypothetical protein
LTGEGKTDGHLVTPGRSQFDKWAAKVAQTIDRRTDTGRFQGQRRIEHIRTRLSVVDVLPTGLSRDGLALRTHTTTTGVVRNTRQRQGCLA